MNGSTNSAESIEEEISPLPSSTVECVRLEMMMIESIENNTEQIEPPSTTNTFAEVCTNTLNRIRTSFTRTNSNYSQITPNRASWTTRLARWFCCGSNNEAANNINTNSANSMFVPVGSAVPSGSQLYQTESEMRMIYPNPFFQDNNPESDVLVHKIIHKSTSEVDAEMATSSDSEDY